MSIFFRSCDSNLPSLVPIRHPRESGDPEESERKTAGKPWVNAINRIVPDLGSRFRANDEKRNCIETREQKIVQNDSPDFVAVYPRLL